MSQDGIGPGAGFVDLGAPGQVSAALLPPGPAGAEVEIGIAFVFDPATPGAGRVAPDAPDLAAATALVISERDRFGNAIGAWLDTVDAAGRAGQDARLRLTGADAAFVELRVTGPAARAGEGRRIPVAHAGGAASFAPGATLVASLAPRDHRGTPGRDVYLPSRAFAETVAIESLYVRTAGDEAPGDGSIGDWFRVEKQPGHALWLKDKAGHAYELRALLGRPPRVKADAALVLAKNVVSGTDDQQALQDFIDAHLDFGLFQEARLPAGVMRLGRGLSCGYGIHGGYRPARLGGLNRGYYATDVSGSTVLVLDFTREPGINVQGARGDVIEAMSIAGRMLRHIRVSHLGEGRGTAIDDRAPESWLDKALYPDGLARYAPDCGIAISGRAGRKPDVAYRDIDYPARFGDVAQYGKGLCSDVILRRLEIMGLPAGIVVGPGLDATGNDDFISLDHGLTHDCVVGFACCHGQHRNIMLDSWAFDHCHTAISTRAFGARQGNLKGTRNCHYGNGIQVFDLADTSMSEATFDNDYCENLWRLGDVAETTAVGKGLRIVQPDFSFTHQLWAADGSAPRPRGVPASLVRNSGSGPLRLSIVGGKMQVGGVAMIATDADGVEVDGTRFELVTERLDAAKRTFYNATAGICFPRLARFVRSERIAPSYDQSDLDSGKSRGTKRAEAVFPSRRSVCTPLWSPRHRPADDPSEPPAWIPDRVSVYPASALAQKALSGRTLTFTLPPHAGETVRMLTGGEPGDPVLHAASGVVFCITGRDGATIRAEMMCGYEPDGEGGLRPIGPVDLDAGSYYLASARHYSPAQGLYGRFEAGSPVIAEIGRGYDGYAAFLSTEIGIGDHIVLDPVTRPYTTRQKIVALDAAARTITLDGPAAISSPTRVRIATLVRTAPRP